MTNRYQDRGPAKSSEYNEKIRAFLRKIDGLAGRIVKLSSDMDEFTTTTTLQAQSVTAQVTRLQQENDNLTAGYLDGVFVLGLRPENIVMTDNTPTDANGVAIPANERLTFDSFVNVLTLGQGNSVPKLKFAPEGSPTYEKHPDAEAVADFSGTATKVVGDPNDPLVGGSDKTYMVIGDVAESTLVYYVRIPTEGIPTDIINRISLDLEPSFYPRLYSIKYTTTHNPALNETTSWLEFPVEIDPDQENSFFKIPGIVSEGEPVYTQSNVARRRYYIGERAITAIRVELRNGINGTSPEGVGNTNKVALGFREIDVDYVSFLKTGKLAFEVTLPETVQRITAIEPRIINGETVGAYDPTTTVWYLSGETWAEADLGADGTVINADTVRIMVTMNMVNGETPVLAGYRISYTT